MSSYGDQSAQLKAIRNARPDMAAWSFSSQQATLRRLNRAFAGFFRRVRAGETPGYPRFKSAHRFDSVEWPKDGDGCRWQPETRRVYLQGIGHVKVTVHRQVQGRVKTIQVRREGRRWMLVLSCDQVPTRPLEPTQATVGVDLGIASFAATSDGSMCPTLAGGGSPPPGWPPPNRSWPASSAGPTTVAEPERQWRPAIARSPTSGATSTTIRRALVARYDLLVIEDLKIRNLVRRPAPRPIPTSRAGSCPTGPPPRPACTGASTTRAGPSSCRSCAPKRKRLDVW